MRTVKQSLQKANNGLHSAPLPKPRAQKPRLLNRPRSFPTQRTNNPPTYKEQRNKPLLPSLVPALTQRLDSPQRLPPHSPARSLPPSLPLSFHYSLSPPLATFLPSSPPPPPPAHLFIYLCAPMYLFEIVAGENGKVISRYKYLAVIVLLVRVVRGCKKIQQLSGVLNWGGTITIKSPFKEVAKKKGGKIMK